MQCDAHRYGASVSPPLPAPVPRPPLNPVIGSIPPRPPQPGAAATYGTDGLQAPGPRGPRPAPSNRRRTAYSGRRTTPPLPPLRIVVYRGVVAPALSAPTPSEVFQLRFDCVSKFLFFLSCLFFLQKKRGYFIGNPFSPANSRPGKALGVMFVPMKLANLYFRPNVLTAQYSRVAIAPGTTVTNHSSGFLYPDPPSTCRRRRPTASPFPPPSQPPPRVWSATWSAGQGQVPSPPPLRLRQDKDGGYDEQLGTCQAPTLRSRTKE